LAAWAAAAAAAAATAAARSSGESEDNSSLIRSFLEAGSVAVEALSSVASSVGGAWASAESESAAAELAELELTATVSAPAGLGSARHCVGAEGGGARGACGRFRPAEVELPVPWPSLSPPSRTTGELAAFLSLPLSSDPFSASLRPALFEHKTWSATSSPSSRVSIDIGGLLLLDLGSSPRR